MLSIISNSYPELLQSGSIQLIGGCSNIPCIRNFIQKLLPGFKILKSIDTNSAVCKGVCYMILSNLYKEHNPLVTTETLLKTNGDTYKLFQYTNTENFNPIIRLNNVNSKQEFNIVDNKNEMFTRFTIDVPQNHHHNSIDIGFTLNYFLMPAPDNPELIKSHNRKEYLNIKYQNLDWTVDQKDLKKSKERINDIVTLINERLNNENPERYKAIEELLSLIEACKMLNVKYNDAKKWMKENIQTASIQDIKKHIKALEQRAKNAQFINL